jgi:hypothetical protein
MKRSRESDMQTGRYESTHQNDHHVEPPDFSLQQILAHRAQTAVTLRVAISPSAGGVQEQAVVNELIDFS